MKGFFQCSLLLSSVVLYVSRIAWQLNGLPELKIVRKSFANREERQCLTGGSGRRQEAASEFTLHSRSDDVSSIVITRRCRGWTAPVSIRG